MQNVTSPGLHLVVHINWKWIGPSYSLGGWSVVLPGRGHAQARGSQSRYTQAKAACTECGVRCKQLCIVVQAPPVEAVVGAPGAGVVVPYRTAWPDQTRPGQTSTGVRSTMDGGGRQGSRWGPRETCSSPGASSRTPSENCYFYRDWPSFWQLLFCSLPTRRPALMEGRMHTQISPPCQHRQGKIEGSWLIKGRLTEDMFGKGPTQDITKDALIRAAGADKQDPRPAMQRGLVEVVGESEEGSGRRRSNGKRCDTSQQQISSGLNSGAGVLASALANAPSTGTAGTTGTKRGEAGRRRKHETAVCTRTWAILIRVRPNLASRP